MLPSFLDGTYQRYKHDTSTFIKWLSETAQSCGYSPKKIATTESASKPAPRLKGKARKLAKQASAAAGPSLSSSNQEQHIVDIKELLPLANAIIKSKGHIVTVPDKIIHAGLRAISARKKCTAHFEDLTADGDTEKSSGNERHTYFTRRIEDVLVILQPLFAKPAKPAMTAPSKTKIPITPLQDVQNRFAQLEVEDTADDVDQLPVEPSKDTFSGFYEVKSPDKKAIAEEKIFAIFCLFEDLEKLRVYLMELWLDYATGKADLITAAAATNTAFLLANRTQEEALAAFPEFSDYNDVLETLLSSLAELNNWENNGKVEIDTEMLPWRFMTADSILSSFCKVLQPGSVPIMKRGYLGTYNPFADRTKMNFQMRYHEDQVLLLELLPEFAYISVHNINFFAFDELTKGIRKMVVTKVVPVWLAFATTVLLGIHHIMRDKVERAFQDLQNVAREARFILTSHIEFSRTLTNPNCWPDQNDKSLQTFLEIIEKIILNDAIFLFKKANSHLRAVSNDEKFYLLKRQPILCGVLAFRTILYLQEFGVAVCNGFGTAIFPAHFYNALKQKPTPVTSWSLMDRTLSIHTPERVFIGAAPKTMDDCLKQINLTLGYSASLFARNRRNSNKPAISKNGPRGLRETSPICELFRQGLMENESMALQVHNIEDLLNEQARDIEIAANPQSKSLRYEWSRNKRLTSVQLLQALRISLRQELPMLKLDYFKLHRQSIMLMRKLNKELREDLVKHFGKEYFENESQLPMVGPWIIMAASRSEKVANAFGVKGTTSVLLEKAGALFDQFMGEIQEG